MGTVTYPNTLTNGTTADASQVMADLNAVAAVVNGGIDSTNLAALAVATANIANLAVTTGKLADASVTTAKVADAAVTSQKFAPTIQLDTAGGATTFTSSVGLGTTLNTLSFTPAVAGRSLYIALMNGSMAGSGGGPTPTLVLGVDGVGQSFKPQSFSSGGPFAGQFPIFLGGMWVVSHTAAAHTVTLGGYEPVGVVTQRVQSALLRVELGS